MRGHQNSQVLDERSAGCLKNGLSSLNENMCQELLMKNGKEGKRGTSKFLETYHQLHIMERKTKL